MIDVIAPERARGWALVVVLIAGGVLCVALFMEFVMGLAPCPLCVMQRIWFAMAGLIAYGGLMHNPRWGIYPLLTTVACAVGAFFSIRQLWLQSLPAEQVPACGPDLAYMIDAFPLSDLLAAMTSGTGDCAEVAWSFLGLSIPAWALVAFALMILASILQFRAGMR